MSEQRATIVYSITLPKDAAHALAETLDTPALESRAAIGLWRQRDGRWTVKILIPEDAENDDIIEYARGAAGRLGLKPSTFRLDRLAHRDWVALGLAGFNPVEAARFFVHGRHFANRRPAGGISLEIDANLAFGTGHHETTRGCLIGLDRILKWRKPQNVLDIGCGSGILGLAAARAAPGRRRALVSDIDPQAVAIARHNIAKNAAASFVRAIIADGAHSTEIRARAPFDLVFINILSGPLYALAPRIKPLLSARADLLLSGILISQARRIANRYRNFGLIVKRPIVLGSWTTLHLSTYL